MHVYSRQRQIERIHIQRAWQAEAPSVSDVYNYIYRSRTLYISSCIPSAKAIAATDRLNVINSGHGR